MHSSRRLELQDSKPGRSDPHSSFRAVFSQARQESRGVAMVGESDEAVGTAVDPRQSATYEVRIEKRRGKRSDLARWNRLGQDGWKLIAVVGKQAIFRRDRIPD
jgi:hypothetical protein